MPKQVLDRDLEEKTKNWKNLWKFVYILAKQCRSPFNSTNFLTKKKIQHSNFANLSNQNLLGQEEEKANMITVPIHFFKWLGFTFEPKTNYSRCSRKRESLRKKASKFPPPPSISAQCSMPLWVWENCLAPHCQWTTDHEHLPSPSKPNTGKSDFANIPLGL